MAPVIVRPELNNEDSNQSSISISGRSTVRSKRLANGASNKTSSIKGALLYFSADNTVSICHDVPKKIKVQDRFVNNIVSVTDRQGNVWEGGRILAFAATGSELEDLEKYIAGLCAKKISIPNPFVWPESVKKPISAGTGIDQDPGIFGGILQRALNTANETEEITDPQDVEIVADNRQSSSLINERDEFIAVHEALPSLVYLAKLLCEIVFQDVYEDTCNETTCQEPTQIE